MAINDAVFIIGKYDFIFAKAKYLLSSRGLLIRFDK